MSYVTGSAVSAADLLAVLQSECQAAGWTLDGNTLSKDNCAVTITLSSGKLVITGAAITGPSAVVNAPSTSAYCMVTVAAWPASYHLHINAHDIFLVVNYNVQLFQWLAFGVAKTFGLSGTGNWFGATYPPGAGGLVTMDSNGGGEQNYTTPAAPFWNATGFNYGRFRTAYLHGWLDGVEWLGDAASSAPSIPGALSPMLNRQPNAWNSEAILLPAQILHARPENKVSIVAELRGCRILRIDNYEPGQLIDLGEDRWKVYPFFAKNISSRNGAYDAAHSGTFGWAIKVEE